MFNELKPYNNDQKSIDTIAIDSMIFSQLRVRDSFDKKLLKLFKYVDRKEFLPPEVSHMAYSDAHIRLGNGYMFSPFLSAYMFKYIQKFNPSSMLEVGSSAGYSSVLLSYLCPKVFILNNPLNNTIKLDLVKKFRSPYNICVETLDDQKPLDDKKFDFIVSMSLSWEASAPEKILDMLSPGGKALFIVNKNKISYLSVFRHDKDKDYIVSEEINIVQFLPLL